MKHPVTNEEMELKYTYTSTDYKGRRVVHKFEYYDGGEHGDFTTTELDERNLKELEEYYKVELAFEEMIAGYKEKYKNVPNDFKSEAVDLMFKDWGFTDSRDLDWLYDDAINHLFYNSTRRIKNLAKRLGYKEVPCETCREIIKN